jgi:mRNA interferase MazF
MVRRGEVWLCALDPTVGREIQNTRPCLVVAPDELNRRLTTTIVAPLTSGSRPTRFRVEVVFQDVDGLVLPDQLRTLDQSRFIKHLGRIDDTSLSRVLQILAEMFAS